MEQQEFDYRENIDIAGEVSAEIDDLSTTELVEVHEAIQKIQEKHKEKRKQKSVEWFNQSLLPILNDFAEDMSASLEICWEKEDLVSATFRNVCGFDMDSNAHAFWMALTISNHISIEKSMTETTLVLAYNL